MTIIRLGNGSSLLSDLQVALLGLQAGVRIGLHDSITGNIYKIDGVIYDSARMAVVLNFDSSKPITLPTV